MPESVLPFAEVTAYATILGLITWLVRRVFTHTIPRLVADFKDSLEKQSASFSAELKNQQDLFHCALAQQRDDFQSALKESRTDFKEVLRDERDLRERLCERKAGIA